jgi:hypothetical protein
MNLSNLNTEDLKRELKIRGHIISPCICSTCKKWSAHLTNYSTFYETLHCNGCMKPVEKCTC